MRELSLHLLDLMENAIEAGSHAIDIAIDEDSATDRLTIVITDDGRGMDAGLAAAAVDPFTTTRTTRRVGLGLALLAAACERCNGKLTLASAPGRGTTVRAEFQLSHIDLAPLGDVAGTLVTIVAANPEVEIAYRHSRAGRQFAVSTGEMRQRLGDVPVNEPAVLEWMRAYVETELSRLSGEA